MNKSIHLVLLTTGLLFTQSILGQDSAVPGVSPPTRTIEERLDELNHWAAELPAAGMDKAREEEWSANQSKKRRDLALAIYADYPENPMRWKAIFGHYILYSNLHAWGDWSYRARARKILQEALYDSSIPDEFWANAKRTQINDAKSLWKELEAYGPAVDTSSVQRLVEDFARRMPDSDSLPLVEWDFVNWLRQSDPLAADQRIKHLSRSPNSKVAALFLGQLRSLELRTNPLELKFTAFDGREVDLAKLRGKVVLIDFWATSCGPCVRELPELLRVYRAYHERGFEIVGISLDRPGDEKALAAFIKKWQVPWPQNFDPNHRWNEVADHYGIIAIPTQWLLGRDGRLVADDARGSKLEAVLKKLFIDSP